MKKFRILGMLVCVLSVMVASANANPDIVVSWGEVGEMGMGNTWMDGMNGTGFMPNGDDSYTIQAGTQEAPMELTGCNLNLTMTYDVDPFINVSFGVKNTLAVDQMFTFSYTSPVIPALTPSTLYFGTTGGSLTAGGDPGSISTVMGTAFYQGLIDSDLVLELHDPLMVPVTTGTVNIPVDETTGFLPGPAADSTLTMIYTFILTPGESASITGAFVVNPVPEPATMALLGLGAVLIRRRKR